MRLFIFILLLTPFSLSAQIKVGAGFGGAASFSDFGSPRYGTPFGLTLTEKLNDKFSMSQNILFRFDGYEFKSDVPGLGHKAIVHQFNFIETPVLLNFTPLKGKISPYIGTGFSTKLCVRSTERISREYRLFQFNDITPKNSLDINLIGLLGIEFKALGHIINIESRYNHGLLEVIENRKLSSFSLFLFVRK